LASTIDAVIRSLPSPAVRQHHGARQYGQVGVTKTWMLTGFVNFFNSSSVSAFNVDF